jgi:hypothetical protein
MTSFGGPSFANGDTLVFGNPAFMIGRAVDRLFGSAFPSPPAGYGYVYAQQGGDNRLLTVTLDDGKTYALFGKLT